MNLLLKNRSYPHEIIRYFQQILRKNDICPKKGPGYFMWIFFLHFYQNKEMQSIHEKCDLLARDSFERVFRTRLISFDLSKTSIVMSGNYVLCTFLLSFANHDRFAHLKLNRSLVICKLSLSLREPHIVLVLRDFCSHLN